MTKANDEYDANLDPNDRNFRIDADNLGDKDEDALKGGGANTEAAYSAGGQGQKQGGTLDTDLHTTDAAYPPAIANMSPGAKYMGTHSEDFDIVDKTKLGDDATGVDQEVIETGEAARGRVEDILRGRQETTEKDLSRGTPGGRSAIGGETRATDGTLRAGLSYGTYIGNTLSSLVARGTEMLSEFRRLSDAFLSGKPLSAASQTLGSTAAMFNNAYDMMDDVAKGAGIDLTADQKIIKETLKGRRYWQDRDRAERVNEYMMKAYNDAVREVIGDDGDPSRISYGQLEAVHDRMGDILAPEIRRIRANQAKGARMSMEDRAIVDTYMRFNRDFMNETRGTAQELKTLAKEIGAMEKEQVSQESKARLDELYRNYGEDPKRLTAYVIMTLLGKNVVERFSNDSYTPAHLREATKRAIINWNNEKDVRKKIEWGAMAFHLYNELRGLSLRSPSSGKPGDPSAASPVTGTGPGPKGGGGGAGATAGKMRATGKLFGPAIPSAIANKAEYNKALKENRKQFVKAYVDSMVKDIVWDPKKYPKSMKGLYDELQRTYQTVARKKWDMYDRYAIWGYRGQEDELLEDQDSIAYELGKARRILRYMNGGTRDGLVNTEFLNHGHWKMARSSKEENYIEKRLKEFRNQYPFLDRGSITEGSQAELKTQPNFKNAMADVENQIKAIARAEYEWYNSVDRWKETTAPDSELSMPRKTDDWLGARLNAVKNAKKRMDWLEKNVLYDLDRLQLRRYDPSKGPAPDDYTNFFADRVDEHQGKAGPGDPLDPDGAKMYDIPPIEGLNGKVDLLAHGDPIRGFNNIMAAYDDLSDLATSRAAKDTMKAVLRRLRDTDRSHLALAILYGMDDRYKDVLGDELFNDISSNLFGPYKDQIVKWRKRYPGFGIGFASDVPSEARPRLLRDLVRSLKLQPRTLDAAVYDQIMSGYGELFSWTPHTHLLEPISDEERGARTGEDADVDVMMERYIKELEPHSFDVRNAKKIGTFLKKVPQKALDALVEETRSLEDPKMAEIALRGLQKAIRTKGWGSSPKSLDEELGERERQIKMGKGEEEKKEEEESGGEEEETFDMEIPDDLSDNAKEALKVFLRNEDPLSKRPFAEDLSGHLRDASPESISHILEGFRKRGDSVYGMQTLCGVLHLVDEEKAQKILSELEGSFGRDVKGLMKFLDGTVAMGTKFHNDDGEEPYKWRDAINTWVLNNMYGNVDEALDRFMRNAETKVNKKNALVGIWRGVMGWSRTHPNGNTKRAKVPTYLNVPLIRAFGNRLIDVNEGDENSILKDTFITAMEQTLKNDKLKKDRDFLEKTLELMKLTEEEDEEEPVVEVGGEEVAVDDTEGFRQLDMKANWWNSPRHNADRFIRDKIALDTKNLLKDLSGKDQAEKDALKDKWEKDVGDANTNLMRVDRLNGKVTGVSISDKVTDDKAIELLSKVVALRWLGDDRFRALEDTLYRSLNPAWKDEWGDEEKYVSNPYLKDEKDRDSVDHYLALNQKDRKERLEIYRKLETDVVEMFNAASESNLDNDGRFIKKESESVKALEAALERFRGQYKHLKDEYEIKTKRSEGKKILDRLSPIMNKIETAFEPPVKHRDQKSGGEEKEGKGTPNKRVNDALNTLENFKDGNEIGKVLSALVEDTWDDETFTKYKDAANNVLAKKNAGWQVQSWDREGPVLSEKAPEKDTEVSLDERLKPNLDKLSGAIANLEQGEKRIDWMGTIKAIETNVNPSPKERTSFAAKVTNALRGMGVYITVSYDNGEIKLAMAPHNAFEMLMNWMLDMSWLTYNKDYSNSDNRRALENAVGDHVSGYLREAKKEGRSVEKRGEDLEKYITRLNEYFDEWKIPGTVMYDKDSKGVKIAWWLKKSASDIVRRLPSFSDLMGQRKGDLEAA